jgi:protein TonB
VIDPLGRPPIVPSIVRGVIALVASSALTLLSLVLVAQLNADPQPTEHTHAAAEQRVVPVAARPEPEPSEASPMDAAQSEAPTEAAPARASIEPPRPRPPAIAGVAPSAGPGSIALPIASAGELPSVASLPSAELEGVASAEPVTPARATHRPVPQYPALAQRRGVEGFVTLRLRVDERGRVQDAVVVDSQPPDVFDQAALRTVRSYRFSPARRGDEAVSTTLQQTIRFELD